MEKRRLGRSDIQITPIIMGTWQAGKKMWVGIEDSQTTKAIRAAFEETISALNKLKQQGKIRAIGVSNFSKALGRIVTDHLDDNPVMWEWN